ncbi:opacity family porin [Conchiformibius steedae]|uniref:Autotransporter outer membrane beta-barrel domain-containing protein n=1 Tax=Conchiformibius steedae TaxID=153493 RepID=A0A3P2A8H8_9NEIS|nr:opacity family porin [Conchiformibius steedae]RRD90580.1 autotransporter outer membrane beta-barrel domain-containing protein [Conchiformibius steedae]
MKQLHKVMIAAAGMLMAGTVAAENGAGFYVQGDVGLANLNTNTEKFKVKNTFKSLKNSYKESGFMPRISAGYDFGNNLRVAGDYTHYKDADNSARDGDTSLHVKTQARSMGVSAVYDFPIEGTAIKPYAGARVGLNKTKLQARLQNGGNTQSSSDSKTKVGMGVLLGASYEISPNISTDVGYRYNHMGSEIKAHEVTAGVRYTFR